MVMWPWLAYIAGAYAIGSIPFGVLIGRARGIDIRQHGSKNIGATNVTRVLGKRLGLLCFALDVLKGAMPVLAAGVVNETLGRSATQLTQTQMWLWLGVAAAAVAGHMFSLFLKFRGGKGVATGFGAAVAMWPLLTLVALGALVVWYVTLRMFKYVSVASMLGAISLPLGYLLSAIPPDATEQPFSHTIDHVLHASPPLVGTGLIALLVVWQHRGNIGRLRRGEEPRISRG
jgi:glycerol-3-phosphate acyltransferase PlsY